MLADLLEIRRKSLEHGNHVSNLVSTMSQLLVMVRLSSDIPDFGEQMRGFVTGGGYIKDLLTESTKALSVVNEQNSDLIDPHDKCWSASSTDDFIEILREFADPQTNSRKTAEFIIGIMKSGQSGFYTTPIEISLLMAELLEEASELVLPTDASALAGISIAKPDQDLIIRVSDQAVATILRRLYFAMGNEVDLVCESLDSEFQFDSGLQVFLIPKFGGKVGTDFDRKLPDELQGPGRLTSDEAALASVISEGAGMVVALVPSGVLFRGGRSRQFRKWLIESAGLTTVISLPPGLLENTGIATAILLIDPQNAGVASPDHVLLLSADSNEYRSEIRPGRLWLHDWQKLRDVSKSALLTQPDYFVTKETIAENDFVLQPARYSAHEKSGLGDLLRDVDIVTLGSVVDIYSPLSVKPSDSPKGTKYSEVRISDFEIDGILWDGSKDVMVGPGQISRIEKQILRPGDIVLGTKGSIGKCAIVMEGPDVNLIAGQTMVILRLKKGGSLFDPIVLLRYLSLPQVRRFLESLSGGAAISFLRKKDLLELPVPIPTPEHQDQIVGVHFKILEALKKSQQQMEKAVTLSDSAFSNLSIPSND